MNLDEAKEECQRWFAYLDRQRHKAESLQRLAAERRAGTCDENEARRRLRQIDGHGVTVYDGAKLEKAVRVLLKHTKINKGTPLWSSLGSLSGDRTMKEITPDKFRCTLVECPAIFTTKCGSITPACPAIAKNGNNYIIIGKIVTVDDHPELAGRIGGGEAAVEIPAELIDEAVKSQIQP